MVVKENTKYKETEIGMIPEDWEVKKISQITTATAGGTPSTFVKEYWSGNILWMNSGELNNKRIFDVENRITDLGLKNSSTKLIPSNSVLIGLAGQGKTRGTAAINYVELCTNQSIAAIFPSDSFISEYLYFNLDFRYDELRLLSTGDGGRGGLNLTIIKNLDIAFPSKSEQQTIANTLTDIDQLINSLEKIIIKKLNIKQGAIQELLSGRKRLPGFAGSDKYKETEIGIIPEDWELKILGELAELSSGGTPPTANHSFYGGNIPWVVIADITNAGKYILETEKNINEKGLQNSSAKLFPSKVLLFAMYASIGKCSIAQVDIACNQAILGIQTKKVNEEFLYYYLSLHEKQFIQMGQTGTQSNLNKGMVSNLHIVYPQPEEQTAIAQVLSDMDLEINALETKLTKYQQIKQGMMENLLTGRIRLV